MKKLSIKSERSHLMSPFMTVTIKADLTGCFNPSRFATALNSLHDIHPLLSSTVELDNSGQAYYKNCCRN